MRTPAAADRRRLLALGALTAAVLTTATACQPDGSSAEPAPAPTSASQAPATAAPPPSSATPTESAETQDQACQGDWNDIDVQLYGHTISKDIFLLTAQEGRWTCANPDAPVWHTIGPKHPVRLADTARISVNTPFYDTNVNKPIDVQTFLDKLESAVVADGNRLVFRFTADPGSGSLTMLDQRWKP
ncbi:hypothetical protein [Streptomyces brasiliensis]|uniref:Lipoprotein n=1 Tax=Streptomyces brasiliensis TaxID=1954 RepID=A0A917P0T8_9ACTN|nr:hypothetical protein [Streptomyces brasiliensis]GGJ49784.1 hypothetical protein GCM10010121_071100 [Streptomyces brasiliensis]